ncbi:MAG: hypothetical protein J6K39_00850 [Clostridia bacterium]|nr:hypothetical protein [Clostridia bacterium]
MNWQNSLYLIIPAVAILLLVFPVEAEVRVSYNPLFNRGVLAVFVFGKKILYYIVSFYGSYVELENEKETKRQELEFSSQKFAVMEEFGRQIKDKIRLKKLYVFYNIGTGDAFLSAMLCGFLNNILLQVFLWVKSHKPTASLCVYDTVSYNTATCEIAGRLAASISFFDVAYSFVHSVILTKRKKQQCGEKCE